MAPHQQLRTDTGRRDTNRDQKYRNGEVVNTLSHYGMVRQELYFPAWNSLMRLTISEDGKSHPKSKLSTSKSRFCIAACDCSRKAMNLRSAIRLVRFLKKKVSRRSAARLCAPFARTRL